MSVIRRDETPWPRCTCAYQITAACPVHGKHTAVSQSGESEVVRLRRQLAGAVTALRAADRLANAITLQCDQADLLDFAAEYEKARTPTRGQ